MQRFTYRVTVAYRGSSFHGFARQPGKHTVESTLVAALSPLVTLAGVSIGGRTDRGVHATGQVISFWSRSPLDERDIAAAIDEARPGDLAALDVRWVPRRFHAQHSASARRYVYLHPGGLDHDVTRIDRLLFGLVGERRSFAAFARDTLPGASLERRLFDARARRVGTGSAAMIRFDFAADGFLRRQVRTLVSTSIREAAACSPEDTLVRISEAKDRSATAPPADPDGLYLVSIQYDPVVSFSRRGHLERRPELPRSFPG